jgi:hypothetical protein
MKNSITYFIVSVLTLLPGNYYTISAQEPIRIKRITDQVRFVNTRDDLITNFRLRYNPREGNDFYLVYNDYRGIETSDMVLREPAFFNKTFILKYVHTFTLY